MRRFEQTIHMKCQYFSLKKKSSAAVVTGVLSVKGSRYTFRESNAVKITLPPFWKEIYFRRTVFALLGSKLFAFNVYSFSKGLDVQESKQEVTEVVSLV